MNRFFIFLGALVVIALACGLVMTSVANSVTSGLGEIANIEMAQAMQAQAHATQFAVVGGVFGQCLVSVAIMAGLVMGGVFVLALNRMQSGSQCKQQQRLLDPGETITALGVFEQEPEDLIFSNWR